MKKLIFSLLLTIGSLATTHAQTKSQVIADISYTMEDFMGDLSNINDRDNILIEHINNMNQNFGPPSYFIYKGKQQDSFRNWLKNYAEIELHGEAVEHSLEIQESSLRKISRNSQDKRYGFDAILKMIFSDNSTNTIYTSWVVTWSGEGNYVKLLEIKLFTEESRKQFNHLLNKQKTILNSLSNDKGVRFNQLIQARNLQEQIEQFAKKNKIHHIPDPLYVENIDKVFNEWVQAGDNIPIKDVQVNCYRNALKLKDNKVILDKLNKLIYNK